jgi:hypothetical protein
MSPVKRGVQQGVSAEYKVKCPFSKDVGLRLSYGLKETGVDGFA